MEGRLSLDRIVNEPELVAKIANALENPSYVIKQQIIQLLIDLTTYNQQGYERVLEIINYYQKISGKRYRFEFLLKELENHRTTTSDYQIVLITFINCVIVSTADLIDRIRIRNEFKCLNLLTVLYNLRKSTNNTEVGIAINRFDEQLVRDEIDMFQGHKTINKSRQIDTNSPIELFYLILKEVSKKPNEIKFVTILQHMYQIDNTKQFSDKIWDVIERFVFLSLSITDANQYYEQFVNFIKHFHQEMLYKVTGDIKIQITPPPPPPPPQKSIKMDSGRGPNDSFRENKRLKTTEKSNSNEQLVTTNMEDKLPQQITPKPSLKMKTINWNKIPTNRIVGKQNLWAIVANNHSAKVSDLNWSEMENLFCQSAAPNTQPISNTSDNHLDKLKRKDSLEIRILEGKKSLNINIFLKQFKCSNDEIIKLIKNGQHESIGTEKLKTLLKILPEFDELEMLKSFDGDNSKLATAERFILHLIQLTNYKLRLESMLLKEEFTTNLSFLSPSINSMILAAEDLMTNQELHEVLYMVLIAGNFLNSGGYAGDAAGIKLSSLQKLTDIRANKPNMNLVHYVAIQAELKDKKLLSFVDKINIIEDAAKITMEQLYNEISTLDNRIRNITKEIAQPNVEIDIKSQMNDFLQTSEIEVKILKNKMKKLESIKRSLAEFFCEDVTIFKFEECFRIFHAFYVKFRQSIAENYRRKCTEEQMNLRRQQREELLAMKRQQLNDQMDCDDSLETQIYESMAGNSHKKLTRKSTNGTVGSEEDTSLSGSPYFSRKRFGSFNNSQNDSAKDDKFSPDITPNGSLRRRRNRGLPDEDDSNLMEFLRSSDHRERKVCGSLDRSWARQQFQGTNKTRPSLQIPVVRQPEPEPKPELKLDPKVESDKSTKIELDGTEMTPKDLRQKIENWLQTTENGPITGIPKIVKGDQIHIATGDSSTLDTLHEEKAAETSLRKVTELGDKNKERKDLIASLGDKKNDDKVTIYLRSNHHRSDSNGKLKFNTLPRNYQKGRQASACWKSNIMTVPDDDNDDTCGNFDRFSSIRRTKRYKKGTNTVADNNDVQVIKTSDNDEGFEEPHSLMSEAASQATSNSNGDTEPIGTSIDLVRKSPKSETNKENRLISKIVPKTKTITPLNTSMLRTQIKPFSSQRLAPKPSQLTAKNIDETNPFSKRSLFSSKSSLSSFNSINTVRRVAPTRTQILTKSSLPIQITKKSNIPKVHSSMRSTVAAKPATSKSFEPAFMKPTASSTTKSNLTRQNFSFRNNVTK